MTSQILFKGKYEDIYDGIPIQIEWELPIDTDLDDLRAIAEEVRRIAYNLRRQERLHAKRRQQLRLQEYALQNLRWLFLTPLEIVVDDKPVVEQLRLGPKKVKVEA